ncbi:hypothetical protein AB0P45_02435 [Streptomyces niveus]|uniref:hypothetical protein n=1 Tax=Streptomyces niveus TaxID=193462 RepID=UPI00341657E2
MRPAPDTYETKRDAEVAQIQADQTRGDWIDPADGEVLFAEYATRWMDERGPAPTADELHRRLLRLQLEMGSSSKVRTGVRGGGVRAHCIR